MPPAGPAAMEVRWVGEPAELRVAAPDAADSDSPVSVEQTGRPVSQIACDGRSFTGIGLRVWPNGTILDVVINGPAHAAGLRPDDTLLDLDAVSPDEHRVGTRVALRYLRDGREMPQAVAIVARICDEWSGRHERVSG